MLTGNLENPNLIITTALYSGQITSGYLGNASVVSGSIASGQIGHPHFGSGAIQSGDVASGQIGQFHLANATVVSGKLGVNSVHSGIIASGQISTLLIASGGLGSGAFGSGQIGSVHLQSGLFTLVSGSIVSGLVADKAVNSGNISSGSIGWPHIASGAIQSGDIGNAAVNSGSIASGIIAQVHLQSGLLGLGSGTVRSGIIGDNAVVSGSIASGSISTFDIASGGFLSGGIGSGQIGWTHHASGSVRSGHIGSSAVSSGNIASGSLGTVHIVSGGLRSGAIASGSLDNVFFISGALLPVSGSVQQFQLGSGAVNSGQVGSGAVVGSLGGGSLNIASGTIGPIELGSGSVRSGAIASGQVGLRALGSGVAVGNLNSGSILSGLLSSGSVAWPTIGDAGVQSGNIASGNIGLYHLSSGAVGSGTMGSGSVIGGNASGARIIASGTIGHFDLGNGVVLSGNIGSGQIFGYHFGSGATATRAQFTGPFFSGYSGAGWAAITEEIISGGRAVALSQSGNLHVAMASVSGRMPAIGYVADNVLSGIQVNVYTAGLFQLSSGMADYSGNVGLAVYVGRSGQVVTVSGSFNSGGFASGDIIQPLGVAWNSGGIVEEIGSVGTATGTESVLSGQIASGSISRFSLASGAVNSGHIASGAVLGSLGGGAFTVASGTIGPNDLGSGSILSGAMASGQLSTFHLGSGATITRTQFVSPFVSGTTWPILSEEIISGTRAVSISQSGNLRIAMASVSGRMPAVGVVVDNVLSGVQANVYVAGPLQFTSGLADYSGHLGFPLFVGRSGHVVSVDASWNSGGFISGDILQTIGHGWNSGGALINLEAVQTSGSLVAVISGQIASGSISRFVMASGAINSGHVASGAVMGQPGGGAFNIASGTVGPNELASGSILSGHIASGQVGFRHLAINSVQSGNLASGQGHQFLLGSGAIISGQVASGSIMGSLGGGAFNIASGSIGPNDLGFGIVVSGSIGSGAINTGNFASGATATRAQFTGPFFSGTNWTLTAEENISGVRAVQISQSGTLRVAMASVSGRMPAAGIVVDNVLSGIQVNVYTAGSFQFTSGLADYSGYLGLPLFVGRSGQIVTASGAFNSGGFASGDIYQQMGVPLNSGGIVLECSEALAQGFVFSGDIQSGQISNVHQASGQVFPYFLMPCVEHISGGMRPVCVASGNFIAIAYAGSGFRLPAVGIVTSNYISGATVQVILGGAWMVQTANYDAGWSGMAGKPIYVGSGLIVTQSGLTSGASWQRMGVAISGGAVINPGGTILSGGYTTAEGIF